ncbi:MAG: D-sedoheptulose 7-phosphate isomerase [Patescibacteria group bacterium]|nr:D-sedoheptulose 7-phosphate isomerase [Patescibacteria group bacterium]
MIKEIIKEFEKSIEVKTSSKELLPEKISKAAKLLIDSYKRGGKMVLCGNGGSAADAQHIAAEMIGRFEKERSSLPALALTSNTSILTCLGNDYSYDEIFARQVRSMVESKDVLVAISTSGNSSNVNKAVLAAKEKGAKTIGLTGKDGGDLARLVNIAIVVPSSITARIQETHITIGHILCQLVEESL